MVCSGTVLRKRKNQNLTFSRGQPVPRDAGRNTVQYDVPIACCTRTAHVCCRDRVETRTASRLGEFISATGGCATDRPGRDAHKYYSERIFHSPFGYRSRATSSRSRDSSALRAPSCYDVPPALRTRVFIITTR